MLAALAAGWRFVARRPALQGVSTEIDRLFRRSSVDRMMRIVAVAALVTTSEWYETARAAYERLHWKTDPMALPTGSPFPWVPGVCLLLTLIVLVTGTRPRLTRTTSSAPQVGQPA